MRQKGPRQRKRRTQIYAGRKWHCYATKDGSFENQYYSSSFTSGAVWLHRQVYEDFHGPIPAGHHVHHKDENTHNNHPDNLEAIGVHRHIKKHWTPERAAKNAAHLAKVGALAKAWHQSPEGLAYHKAAGLKLRKGYKVKREKLKRK